MKIKFINILFIFLMTLNAGYLHSDNAGEKILSLNEDELLQEKKKLDLLDLTVQTNLAFRYFPSKISYYLNRFSALGLADTAEYKYFIALDYYNKNLKSESLLNAIKSAEIDPGYPPSLNLIGVLYSDAGRISEATDYFRRSVKESPWDPTYNYNYANNLFRLHRSAEALNFADNAINLKSNVRDAAYLKGLILIELNEKQKAADAFALARINGLKSEEFMKQYMRTVLDIGDEIKSLELLSSVETYPDIDSKRMSIAVRMKMGEYSKVISILNSFIYTKDANLKDKENFVIAHIKMKGAFEDVDKLTDDESEKIHLVKLIDTLKNKVVPAGPEIRDPILNPIN